MWPLTFAVLAVAGLEATARADEQAPARVLTLECAAPDLPTRPGASLRLSCWTPAGAEVQAVVKLRVSPPWTTLDPLARDDLWDPFIPARARYVDPFEGDRYARPRTPGDLRDPFGGATQDPPAPGDEAKDDSSDRAGAKVQGYVDPFEGGRYARPRTMGELRDPFGGATQDPPVSPDEAAD